MRLFRLHNTPETTIHTRYEVRDREEEILMRCAVYLREKQESGRSQVSLFTGLLKTVRCGNQLRM